MRLSEREVDEAPSETATGPVDVAVEDAEQLVLRAAARHRIVILNETHYQPEHRAFGARLMRRLRRAGVRYLALETSRQAPLDEAMRSGEVLIGTDDYAFEPQRAGLIRAALRAGMKLVAFNHWSAQEDREIRRDPVAAISIRERAMARNIDETILRRDPHARVLVWVGMGHACKVPITGPSGKPFSLMARELWQRTGIEPFSIYQWSDAGLNSAEGRSYRDKLRLIGGARNQPVAVALPGFGYGVPRSKHREASPVYARILATGTDAWIIHPPHPVEHGVSRPRWLAKRPLVRVEGSLQGGAGGLIQALPLPARECTAPADQVLVNGQAFRLELPRGRFIIRVWRMNERSGTERVAAEARVRVGPRPRQLLTIRLDNEGHARS